MRAIEMHAQHRGARQDLAGRMGPQTADGFEADLEESSRIEQCCLSVHLSAYRRLFTY